MEILEVAFHNVVTGNTSFVALVALVKLFQLSMVLFVVRAALAIPRGRKTLITHGSGGGNHNAPRHSQGEDRHWGRANAQLQPQPAHAASTRPECSDSAFTGDYDETDWHWIAAAAGCQTVRS